MRSSSTLGVSGMGVLAFPTEISPLANQRKRWLTDMMKQLRGYKRQKMLVILLFRSGVRFRKLLSRILSLNMNFVRTPT
jgi:hypothetical protein